MTTKITTLTERQAEWMAKIRVFIEVSRRAAGKASPGATISEWVMMRKLTDTFKVPANIIDQLVKKGYLIRQPSGGFGPMVKPAHPGQN
jgi:hypothetical protein